MKQNMCFLLLLSLSFSLVSADHERPGDSYREEILALCYQLSQTADQLKKTFDDGYGPTRGYNHRFSAAIYQLDTLIEASQQLAEDAANTRRYFQILNRFTTLYNVYYPADEEVGKLKLVPYQNQLYDGIRDSFHKIAARFKNLPTHLFKTQMLADQIGSQIPRVYELSNIYFNYQKFQKELQDFRALSENDWAKPRQLRREYNQLKTAWSDLYNHLVNHCNQPNRHSNSLIRYSVVLQMNRYIEDTEIYLSLTYSEAHEHNCQCGHYGYSHIHFQGCSHGGYYSHTDHHCGCGCPQYVNVHFQGCSHHIDVHQHNCRCGHRKYRDQHYPNCGHNVHTIHNCQCGCPSYKDSHYRNCGHEPHRHHCRCGHPQYADQHYGNCGHTVHVHNCRCGHAEYADAHYGNCGHTVHVHNCRCGHAEYANQHYGNCGHRAW